MLVQLHLSAVELITLIAKEKQPRRRKRLRMIRAALDGLSADEIAAELGSWARGYARSQRLSGAKARRNLGWAPMHLDPETEIAAIP